jgi:hypothetical protein
MKPPRRGPQDAGQPPYKTGVGHHPAAVFRLGDVRQDDVDQGEVAAGADALDGPEHRQRRHAPGHARQDRPCQKNENGDQV